MQKKLVIKKIAAAALLIVFAFSITPTIVFHNWLAHHTDTVKKPSSNTGDQLGKRTFHCHCDNIVAESPFTQPEKIIATPAIRFFAVVKVTDIVQPVSSFAVFYSLRGPPVV